jgi:transcriptional regulator with XRE-family HTH domain
MNTVAELVTSQIEVCKARGKTQKQIADEVGFTNANMITQIKKGDAKLPPDKASKLAVSLGLDPKTLLVMALNESSEGMGDFVLQNIDALRKFA